MSFAAPVLVNGQPTSVVSAQDRGLQYGDGLFETMRCEQGRVRWFDRHLARLGRGCERLGIAAPAGELLRAEAESLAATLPRALVKVIVTRGAATARGYRPNGDEQPTRIVSIHPWPPASPAEFRAGLSTVALGVNPLLAGLKHLNRLEQVLAQRAAARAGLHEVLMRCGGDNVVCGSMSNVFVWRGAELLTPPLGDCGVEGVMRSLVMTVAARCGLSIRVAPLSVPQLAEAPAMFVTNVRLGIQPVHWYEGRGLEVDERGARLQELIDGTP